MKYKRASLSLNSRNNPGYPLLGTLGLRPVQGAYSHLTTELTPSWHDPQITPVLFGYSGVQGAL